MNNRRNRNRCQCNNCNNNCIICYCGCRCGYCLYPTPINTNDCCCNNIITPTLFPAGAVATVVIPNIEI